LSIAVRFLTLPKRYTIAVVVVVSAVVIIIISRLNEPKWFVTFNALPVPQKARLLDY